MTYHFRLTLGKALLTGIIFSLCLVFAALTLFFGHGVGDSLAGLLLHGPGLCLLYCVPLIISWWIGRSLTGVTCRRDGSK